MASDDDLESRLSEFRRRYREKENDASSEPEDREDAPGPPGDPDSPPDEPSEPASPEETEIPAGDGPDTPGEEDGKDLQSRVEDLRSRAMSMREVGLPGWLWLVLGCSGLIVMTGFALGFGLWGGYRLLRTQVLVSSPDGVGLAREMIRFDMPDGARSRATVNMMYRLAIVENRTDPSTVLLAVGSFPAGWSGNPEEVFVDRFDRHIGRGRLTLRPGNDREETRRLCGRTVSYQRRTGSLNRNDTDSSAVMYHSCFRRPGGTLCVRCLGLGPDADQRARDLFDSLDCP